MDLSIPDFLIRKGRKLTHAEASALNVPNITWAPFRDYKNAPPKAPDPIYVTNDAAPVTVNVRQKEGAPRHLADYACMAEFNATHDRKMYPVIRTTSDKDMTIILVRAAPWAPKADDPPPTKAQMPQRPKDNWNDSIAEACRSGATHDEVLDFLCRAYPREERGKFFNVLYGRLERMVKQGQLTRAKVGRKVIYTRVAP